MENLHWCPNFPWNGHPRPPTRGWKVPYDGPVDETFSIGPVGAAPQADRPTAGFMETSQMEKNDSQKKHPMIYSVELYVE